MDLRSTVRNWIINLLDLNDLTDVAARNRIERLAELRSYYDGMHKAQLKVKPGKYDDNIIVNLCGLIVDKAVSALIGDPADGHGLTWTFPSEAGEGEPRQITWLNEQWEANQREIFLHKNALVGAESGFPSVKIVPDGNGSIRLVNLNPLLLTVEVDPQDGDNVKEYCIRYIVNENDRQIAYKEETKPAQEAPPYTSWLIETKRQAGGKRWEVVESVDWLYEFPPILTWQNLPCTDSPYGRSDIEGIIGIQDKYNFLMSNISKIIRLYAHPQRYAKNLGAQTNDFKVGPDEMPSWQGEGEILQLPPVGDLPGAMMFLQSLRESAFALSREVDILSLKDKVGAITNFALRVLYHDTLDKLGTKRMLYGAAYQELNRRLLVLGGFAPETCIINWPDPLPVNEQEETTSLQADIAMQLVSKQTAREARGYDNKQEQERMSTEAASSQNAGGLLLQNFFKTSGMPRKQPTETMGTLGQ